MKLKRLCSPKYLPLEVSHIQKIYENEAENDLQLEK